MGWDDGPSSPLDLRRSMDPPWEAGAAMDPLWGAHHVRRRGWAGAPRISWQRQEQLQRRRQQQQLMRGAAAARKMSGGGGVVEWRSRMMWCAKRVDEFDRSERWGLVPCGRLCAVRATSVPSDGVCLALPLEFLCRIKQGRCLGGRFLDAENASRCNHGGVWWRRLLP